MSTVNEKTRVRFYDSTDHKRYKNAVLTEREHIINQDIFKKWSTANFHNPVLVKQMTEFRNDILGSKFSWYEREMFTAMYCGYEHLNGVTGPDARKPDGTYVEIKTCWTYDAKPQPRSPRMVFNNNKEEVPESLKPKRLLLSYFLNSDAVFIAEMDYPDSLLEEKSRNTTNHRFDVNWSDWISIPNIEWKLIPSIGKIKEYDSLLTKEMKRYLTEENEKLIEAVNG